MRTLGTSLSLLRRQLMDNNHFKFHFIKVKQSQFGMYLISFTYTNHFILNVEIPFHLLRNTKRKLKLVLSVGDHEYLPQPSSWLKMCSKRSELILTANSLVNIITIISSIFPTKFFVHQTVESKKN